MEEITTDVHAYSYAIMSCLERLRSLQSTEMILHILWIL